MKDYRIPIEFTAILVIPENAGEPAFASISDKDVRFWVGELTFQELVYQNSIVDPTRPDGKLDPGLYYANCKTVCSMDEVFINIRTVTKQ